MRFTASNVHVRPDIGKTLHMQKLAIDARGLKLEIHSSNAPAKYVGRRAHLNTPAKYMHLNLGFPNGIPKGASGGVFAEMAGIANTNPNPHPNPSPNPITLTLTLT